MKRLTLFLVAALAACSPPPEADTPDPGQPVEAIARKVVNSDGPYAARIEIKITYHRDYDDALNRGFWTGTVTNNGNTWTNRSFIGPTYDHAWVCPALWVYMNKPGGATIVDVSGLYPYSVHLGKGTWGDPQNGATTQQVLDCSYKVDNVGINRTQNVNYKLWVGVDCTLGGFGGYAAGGNTELASGVDYWSWNLSPANPPDGASPRYMIYQGGPGVFDAHSLWQSASYGCNQRRIPNGGTLPNVVVCGSTYLSGFCVGWLNLGNLVW